MVKVKPNKYSSIDVKAFMQYLLLFVFFTVHGSAYWLDVWSDIKAKPAIIFILVFTLWYLFKLSIHKFIIIYISFNLFIHGIDAYVQEDKIIGSEAMQQVMPFFVYLFLIWVFYKIDSINALTRFVKLTTLMAFFSIICFTIQNIYGQSFFSPISNMLDERGLYGFLLYVVATKDLLRNYGMFGEPGIYQIIVNTAIFVMLFWKKYINVTDKDYQHMLAILIIALITIHSAVGFIELACIILGLLIKGSSILKKRMAMVVMVLIILVSIDYMNAGDESLIYKFFINKIMEMDIGNTTAGFDENTSGGARLYVLSMVFDSFKDNMLWGIGENGLNHLLGYSTRWTEGGTGNALGLYLIRRGLLPTLAVVVPIMYRCYKNRENMVEFLVIFSMFFITAFAQSQLMYTSYMLLAFGDVCKNSFRNKYE